MARKRIKQKRTSNVLGKKAEDFVKQINLQKAAKSLSVVEEYYARILCGMNGGSRLKIYKKLASLLRNRFSLMDALDRIYGIVTNNGKNTKEPMAIAITCWSRSLRNGDTLSVAMRGWAPARERLMLSVGDVSDLEGALLNLIKVSEGSSKMMGPLIGALAYPAFLAMMAVVILAAIGIYMVPPMIEAAPDTIWKGIAKDLVVLSFFIANYWFVMLASLPILFLVIFFSLSRWKGKIRVVFDAYPPYSMYRTFVGVGWLLALAALVKAGTPVSRALRMLRQDASPYLLERIDRSLIYINNGDNLGEALFKTEMNFPDIEIIGDLRIYSELDRFEQSLDAMANDWLEESITSIVQQAALLNMAAILMVGGVISWAVLGTFEMQEQITSSMGG